MQLKLCKKEYGDVDQISAGYRKPTIRRVE